MTNGTNGMIAVDKMGTKVLFLNPNTFQIEVVLDGFLKTVHELLVVPETARAYVPIFGDGIHGRNPNPQHLLCVFDLEKRAHIDTIDLRPYIAPHTLKLGPDGLIYITCENSAVVAVIDRKTNTVVEAIDSGSTNGHRLVVSPDGQRPRRFDLAEQLPLRQVDHRHGRVFLVLRVKPLAVRRDDQPVAVGRTGIDCLDHLVGVAVDHRDRGAVLAGDVDQAVRSELERVRRDQRPQVDGVDQRPLVEIEHAQMVLRVRIAAVDAVAEDRHVGAAGFRHHQELMHGAGKSVEHDLGLVGRGIEEQHLAAHLVDRDQPACVAVLRHGPCPVTAKS